REVVPVLLIFDAPTIAEMSAYLLERYAAGEGWTPIPSVLVGLQPGGSKPPLFLVHPLSGELFLYRQLIAALGPEQPVYGFQAVGFATDEEPLETIEEMAAAYVSALLAFQPQGPYLLAGSSMGGPLAFEMARKLRSESREVAFLGLIDPPDPARFVPTEEEIEAEAEHVILSYVTKGQPPMSREQLGGLAPEERLRFLLELGHAAGTFAPAFGLRELGRLVGVVGANRRSLRAYAPQPFSAKLSVIKASETLLDNHAVWNGLSLGGAELHQVHGSHMSIHFQPQVETLAATLRDCIERALREKAEAERDLSGPEGPSPTVVA
ncbi:MAG TPA: thioesterase domain-containing protein, partial [Thermoanaerobaculia bacterium]|nr:thioesterase domain-containing protein [Thermoanaerobaculia bacterium]